MKAEEYTCPGCGAGYVRVIKNDGRELVIFGCESMMSLPGWDRPDQMEPRFIQEDGCKVVTLTKELEAMTAERDNLKWMNERLLKQLGGE